MSGDPFDRTWIETKILLKLQDSPHPVLLAELRDNLVPDIGVSVVCSLDSMRKEGLVNLFRPSPRNEIWVELTAMGRAVLFHIMTAGRSGCV